MTPSNPSSQPIWPFGWTVRHVAETGSTNDDLVAAARDGAPDRTVIVADYQTAGKGRLDRTWEARRGSNLLVSMLFRYESQDPSRYSRIVALAARAACERLGDVGVAVKWPNDLVIGERKLGGLLAVGVPQEKFVVVGIGVLPNDELAEAAGLSCDNGIVVDEFCRTSDAAIYAIGDCSNHPSLHYGRRVRLESVDNAVEQANTTVANILGTPTRHDRVPWFWSDQYHHKMLIVGLSQDHDRQVLRGTPNDAAWAAIGWRFSGTPGETTTPA